MNTKRQKMMKSLVVFTDKYPFIGPLFWILSIQYLIVQVITASAWSTHYSWKNNFISDLGNTSCGIYSNLYVCSPLHGLMNFSFGLFGFTMALGALLIYTEFKRTPGTLIGFVLMSLAGFGTLLVGLFPENSINHLHTFGAFLGLGVGNISILILGLSLSGLHRAFRIYTVLTSLVCLSAFMLFVVGIYLGIGRGGMERLASYPFALWMIAFGVYMSAVRLRWIHSRHSSGV